MRLTPQGHEYRREGDGIRHLPTGTWITIDYRSERDEWTVSHRGRVCNHYDEDLVVMLGAEMLLLDRADPRVLKFSHHARLQRRDLDF